MAIETRNINIFLIDWPPLISEVNVHVFSWKLDTQIIWHNVWLVEMIDGNFTLMYIVLCNFAQFNELWINNEE